MKVKPNWQNEEIPILVNQGGPVHKTMWLTALDGKKTYSFTMNDINLVTSYFGTKAEIVVWLQKCNKT